MASEHSKATKIGLNSLIDCKHCMKANPLSHSIPADVPPSDHGWHGGEAVKISFTGKRHQLAHENSWMGIQNPRFSFSSMWSHEIVATRNSAWFWRLHIRMTSWSQSIEIECLTLKSFLRQHHSKALDHPSKEPEKRWHACHSISGCSSGINHNFEAWFNVTTKGCIDLTTPSANPIVVPTGTWGSWQSSKNRVTTFEKIPTSQSRKRNEIDTINEDLLREHLTHNPKGSHIQRLFPKIHRSRDVTQ